MIYYKGYMYIISSVTPKDNIKTESYRIRAENRFKDDILFFTLYTKWSRLEGKIREHLDNHIERGY
jgi:uncharacterized protein YegL